MRTIGIGTVVMVAPVVCALSAPALAGPFDPAYKGAPDSVHVAFERNGDNLPWTVDEFSTGASTYPLDMHGPDSSESGVDAVFICPNFIDPLPIKYIRIQMFFDGPIDVNLLNVQVVGHDPLGATGVETGRGGEVGPFSVYYIDFEIRPNPDWEEFFFFGNESANIRPGNFLRIEIDTISIPAPSGVAPLVAFGALAMRRRR